MTLPTVQVQVQVLTPAGSPVVGARVTANLNRADRDLAAVPPSWVFPSVVTGTTDESGAVTLAVWPNARGADGSAYRWTVRDTEGAVLLDALASVPATNCALADLTMTPGSLPPWPAADSSRVARLVQDVADLLAESTPSAETIRKVTRWIDLVLQICQAARRWRFAEALVETTIGRGVDQFDLVGDLAGVQALFGRVGSLRFLPLGALQDARANAALYGGVNGGTPQWYALEGNRRVHLFPVPREDEPLAMLYQRPLTVATIPTEMEYLIINGVLGRYGRHFDRDALSQDPAEFEARFQRELPIAGRGSWDASTIATQEMLLREPLMEQVARVTDGAVQIAV